MRHDPEPPKESVQVVVDRKPVAIMRPEKLLAIIRFLVSDTSRVTFSEHAQERMVERGILPVEVYRVLERGYMKGEIRPGVNEGEWVCKVACKLRGSREIGVVTVVIQSESLWLNTVEWEDK